MRHCYGGVYEKGDGVIQKEDGFKTDERYQM
jgi:hypothetical protein